MNIYEITFDPPDWPYALRQQMQLDRDPLALRKAVVIAIDQNSCLQLAQLGQSVRAIIVVGETTNPHEIPRIVSKE